MNVQYTNECPIEAARGMCRAHRNKMLVEYCQLMSTAHHVMGSELDLDDIYKPFSPNSMFPKWVRQSAENYAWLWTSALELLELYKRDTGKSHKCEAMLKVLYTMPVGMDKEAAFTPPPLTKSAPDYLHEMYAEEPIEAHRCYIDEKLWGWFYDGTKVDSTFFEAVPFWYTIPATVK